LADIRREADAGHWPEAERHCRELLAQEGLNPLLHLYHALILEQRGVHAEAERALRRSIYLDRSFVLAHYYLALLLQRNRDPRGAQRSFRNVVRLLDGTDPARAYPEADGLTAAELAGLARMHLDVLEGCSP
jgi:chemotaxis protein methyltransferase CheR